MYAYLDTLRKRERKIMLAGNPSRRVGYSCGDEHHEECISLLCRVTDVQSKRRGESDLLMADGKARGELG
jgi:hypothetical protein